MRFASAADRAAFIQELTAGVGALVRKYDSPDAEGGRDHRIVVAVHPTVKPETSGAAGTSAASGTSEGPKTSEAPPVVPELTD